MRLFIAYKIHINTAKDIYLNIVNFEAFKGHKIVDYNNYHITFKFLGDINLSAQIISDKLAESLCGVSSFHFYLSNEIGYMPSSHKPKLAYLKIYEEDDKFNGLFKNIDNGMGSLGFELGRMKFMPHLTLVRFREAKINHAILPTYIDKQSKTEVILDKVSLFQSILRPEGPIYKEVFSVKL
ncbi:RNA 2',3'-cyclic phosphodiesterase [Thermodesulfobium sp. 4217-1]|uniref:RNA 2',3'-cyclic phosphodiesterase n=1 Tax=Thermodesulfobium sp. 4217-1 TaxID=3120013 RepID=UPI003221B8BF